MKCAYLILFFASLVVSLGFGILLIKLLRQAGLTQPVRRDGPEEHLRKKVNIPTIGGLIFLVPLFILSLILFLTKKNFQSQDFIVVAGVTFLMSLLGFADDYLKILKKRNKGITGWTKICVQLLVSAVIAFLYKDGFILLYIVWVFFVISGSANSYNLTDGLDGLLASISFVGILGMIIFLNYNSYFELACFLSIFLGGILGFLYFNKHPAKVFMGDTGSLAIGGAVGVVAIVTKSEFYLLSFAIIPILEALSVILQVVSCQFSKRFLGKDIRIFKMAPLHHHFELSGWSETKVVKRFFIFQLICTLIGLVVFWIAV